MAEHELPLEAATNDVIARYKRGNDMLQSAAMALRRLRERVESGEAGPKHDWTSYRVMYLEPHMGKAWINKQLALAPPGATAKQVSDNADSLRKRNKGQKRKSRQKAKSGGADVSVSQKNNVQSLPVGYGPGYVSLCRAWENATIIERRQFLVEYGLSHRAA